MDLSKAEEVTRIHRRTMQERSYDPGNHDGVITYLQPDILECKVKWALGSITTNKTSRGDGIPVELFQILKDDVVKVLHSICQQIWKTQQWSQDWERSVFISIPDKGNVKECSNYYTVALTSPDLPVAPQDEAGLTKTFQTWPRGWFHIPQDPDFPVPS